MTLSRLALAEAPEAEAVRMLQQLFDRLGAGEEGDIGAVHLRAVLDLLRHTAAGKESRLDLPHGVTARFCRDWLILETRPQTLTEIQLLPDRPVTWGDCRLTLLGRREGEGLAIRPETGPADRVVTVGPVEPGDRLCLPETRGGEPLRQAAVPGPPDLSCGSGTGCRPCTREGVWPPCGGWAWTSRLHRRRGRPAGSFRSTEMEKEREP